MISFPNLINNLKPLKSGVIPRVKFFYCLIKKFNNQSNDAHSGMASLIPDLVFFDIVFFDGTGFDLLDQLDQKKFSLIFTTSHEQFAMKVFGFMQ